MTAEAEADEAVEQRETDRLAYRDAMDAERAAAEALVIVYPDDPGWLPWGEYRIRDWVDDIVWDEDDEGDA